MRVFFMAKTAAAPSPDPATADAAPPQPLTLILALEAHHGDKFDRDRAVSLISEGTVKGFFPALQPARRRR
jgi:hypothetical protein